MTAIPKYATSLIQKRATSYFPLPPPSLLMEESICDWESHSAFIAGVESLEAYQAWVTRVVLPIAFQWIAEHHKEVYDKIEKLEKINDENLKDDVGVVIAAAFELVRKTPEYEKGREEYEKYKKEREDNTLVTKDLNPVWTRITREVRKATNEIYQAEKKYLDDTI